MMRLVPLTGIEVATQFSFFVWESKKGYELFIVRSFLIS